METTQPVRRGAAQPPISASVADISYVAVSDEWLLDRWSLLRWADDGGRWVDASNGTIQGTRV
jgi:hypothetical protein